MKPQDHLKKITALKNAFNINHKTKRELFQTDTFIRYATICQNDCILLDPEDRPDWRHRTKVAVTRMMKSNCITNYVTAIEVGLKQLIQSRSSWDENGLNQLLADEKINLNQAYHLFRKSGPVITREFLVTYHHGLHNYDSINRVFSALLDDGNFLDKVGIYEVRRKGKVYTLNKLILRWKDDLKELFHLRHNFVHNGILVSVSDDRLDKFEELTMAVLFFAEKYCKDRKIRRSKGSDVTKRKQKNLLSKLNAR